METDGWFNACSDEAIRKQTLALNKWLDDTSDTKNKINYKKLNKINKMKNNERITETRKERGRNGCIETQKYNDLIMIFWYKKKNSKYFVVFVIN